MPVEATTEHEYPETILDLSANDLILSLRGGGYDDKVLHVRSNRCTLGGRADCTVQLPDGAPLQCVILRGTGGTIVRDWTGEARLNGQPFSDAALRAGDCLQVGPVTVKVLADCPADYAASASAAAHRQDLSVPDHAANDDAANRGPGSDAFPEDIHMRFDHLEGRLTSLERMIGELLNLQHQAATHSAVAAAQPHSHPFPTPCAEADIPTVRKEPPPAPEATRDARGVTEMISANAPSPGVQGEVCGDAGVVSPFLPVTPHSPPPPSAPPVESETKPSAADPDASQVPPWDPGTGDEGLDPSVREYIERLLRQVSSPTGEPLPAAGDFTEQPDIAQPASAAAADSHSGAPDEDAPEAAVADTVEDQPAILSAPSVLQPLSLPPERESSLDAMREVANMSATAAIRTFEKQQAARKTFDRLPLLLIGLVCGLMLLCSAFSSGESGMFVGAGAAFLAAALTAWQVLVVARRWLWASRPVE